MYLPFGVYRKSQQEEGFEDLTQIGDFLVDERQITIKSLIKMRPFLPLGAYKTLKNRLAARTSRKNRKQNYKDLIKNTVDLEQANLAMIKSIEVVKNILTSNED